MSRLEEIEARKLEIREELEATEEVEKVEELETEVDALNEEKEQIEEVNEVEQIAETEEIPVEAEPVEIEEERKDMEKTEKRNTKEYINAYAEYLKEQLSDKYKMKDEERALITTGGYATGNSATVEVPDLVDNVVRTAWERDELGTLVRRLAVKGNYKVQFEVSGSDATIHQEGNGAVSEESLVLGIVSIEPKSIKKWISVSDEVLDMRGEAFLEYIYDELTYRIAKKCIDTLVYNITQLPTSLSPNGDTGIYDTVSANKITEDPSAGTIAKAISQLSDEARDITIVMNKQSYANFKAVQYGLGYGVDVFENARVVFNNSLPAFDSANQNAVYCIVGDFGNGALFTFPNGESINLKYDDLSAMEYDLVRILGREYVGIGLVADKSFVNIAKAGSTPSA